jgi:RNA polymerase sigma factor (sigma-70 family)
MYSDKLVSDLFQQHRPTLLAFLVNRVRCAETAQDLSQDVFVRLLRKGELDHDDNLGGYLYRIAERLALDFLRQAQRGPGLENLDENLHCPKLLPDEITDLHQQCERLLDAIAALPKKVRHVFLLRKIDELSYGEIAQRLGICEKTV